jgi:hypothetical protein
MRLLVIVKSDAVYKKIQQLFSEKYEVLNNIPHFVELQEFVISDEASVAILDDSIHWKERAEQLLLNYGIPVIHFKGNFDDLVAKIEGKETVEKKQVSSEPNISTEKKIPSISKDQTVSKRHEKMINVNDSKVSSPANQSTPPKEIIREIPKFIEREVIKEIPVEKIVEREVIREVPVEKIIEKQVTKTEVIEVKPNFDNVDIDFELPSIIPDVTPAIESITNNEQDRNQPIFIGIIALEKDVDISHTVFLLGSSLAKLGQRPLIVSDGSPEIEEIEKMIFKGEKEDVSAQCFESDGITYMRKGVIWDFADLLASDFTHIIMWFDTRGQKNIAEKFITDWLRTQYPLLISSGASWKTERLKEIINGFSPSIRKRAMLLLQQEHPGVLSDLRKLYPELQISAIPMCLDPFSPDQLLVDWVAKLFSTKKRRKLRGLSLILIVLIGLIISVVAIFLGLQVDIPND